MLYLVLPNLQLRWIDLHERTLDHLPDGYELADLPWLETTDLKLATELTVRMALRYGVACRGGIVLAARWVVEQNRALEIGSTVVAAQESMDKLRSSQGDLMERIDPGWRQRGSDLDQAILASALEAMDDAAAEAQKELEARYPEPDLMTHWWHLTGSLPKPL